VPLRSFSDVVYTALAWAPVLAFIIGFVLFLTVGMMHFEARTWGTEWFISNQGSVNEVELATTGADTTSYYAL
jgi:hypothetical protein